MEEVARVLGRLPTSELLVLAEELDVPIDPDAPKAEIAATLAAVLSARSPVGDGAPPIVDRAAALRRRRKTERRLATYVDQDRHCAWLGHGGEICGLPVVRDGRCCVLHGGLDVSDLSVPITGRLGADTWPALLRHLRMASYDTDVLGLDPVIAEMLWHVANVLYFEYFRVEVDGIRHVPDTGPGVLVGNHGGAALPYDGLMMQLSVANEARVPRRVRLIGTEIFNMLPVVSHLYRKAGAAYASREDALWVLGRGSLLGVFPEGVRGFQKPVWEAYRLQRFGRGGFVDLAMRTGAPIVPVAILGSEEVHPALFTSRRLAELVRTLFPQQRVQEMAVWVNPIPLPVHWRLRFLPPIDVGGPTDRPDRLEVLEVTEAVRSTIQDALDDMIERRRRIF